MIDVKRIENDKENVEAALKKRMDNVNLDEIIELNTERKKLITEVSELQSERNTVSKELPIRKNKGEDIKSIVGRMRIVGDQITEYNQKIKEIESLLNSKLSELPNIPDDDVAPGGKENNVVLSTWGEKTNKDFELKDHVTLEESLHLVDYKRGVKLAGQGNWIYTGIGARLEWALINFFIETHISDGWEFMLVPHMLTYDCGYTAGQFPKFQDEVYWINENDSNGKFILPTAETALVNIHRGEILKEEDLPKKYFSFTPCYRREAGTSRVEERGTVRGHQFNKVEMVQYTKQGDSERAFDEMLEKAERLVQALGLHYQVSKLAAGDCSAGMCRTYDIEIWIPSMGIYKEVSSISNSRDYQARRGNMKYRDGDTGEIKYVHTLNASGLATSRLLPALLEQNQLEDGSVLLPEVLRKYFDGKERITAD